MEGDLHFLVPTQLQFDNYLFQLKKPFVSAKKMEYSYRCIECSKKKTSCTLFITESDLKAFLNNEGEFSYRYGVQSHVCWSSFPSSNQEKAYNKKLARKDLKRDDNNKKDDQKKKEKEEEEEEEEEEEKESEISNIILR